MILLNFAITILLYNSVVMTEASKILEHLKSLPLSLQAIEDVPRPLFLKKFPLFDEADRIYRQLNVHKKLAGRGIERLMDLSKFAGTFTSSKSKIMLDDVNVFVENVIPYCQEYMRSMATVDGRNEKCEDVKGQSLNYMAYSAFRYISSVIKKAYSIILQTRIINNSENLKSQSQLFVWDRRELDFISEDQLINSYKRGYETTVKKIVSVFKDLVNAASTRIAPCEPTHPLRGKTYLEMEKFLQGIFPQEITLNKWNSGEGTCTDYKDQGTAYYPYENIRHDGDWKCHGLMYECFQIPQAIDIYKPTSPMRRVDGVVPSDCDWVICTEMNENFHGLGKYRWPWIGRETWTLFDWRYRMPFSFYELEQCACICDDFDHPRTLRKFSREYAMSDFRNNRVVTGIRLVNISNVIHIQIQEGELEGVGFINSSTVKWRLNNNIENHSTNPESRSSDETVTLLYHKRRVNLDVFFFSPNDVVIGAAFDWTREMDGVELTVFVTTFSFSTGELNQDYRRTLASDRQREKIVQNSDVRPRACFKSVPAGGDNKFIEFQTTDWEGDAAQTTMPYLDIQEVVTEPPAMLRGLGLYFKNEPHCIGYIGLELHSHNYENFVFPNHNN